MLISGVFALFDKMIRKERNFPSMRQYWFGIALLLLVFISLPSTSCFSEEMSQGQIQKLIDNLVSNDINSRALAENKLLNMEAVALPELSSSLLGDNDELALKSAEILAEIGSLSIPILIRILSDGRFPPYSPRNNAAVDALSRIGIIAIPDMIEASLPEDEFSYHTLIIMDAVREIGPSAIPALDGMVKNENPAIRYLVAILLGDMKDETAVPSLTYLLRDNYKKVRAIAVISLKKLGTKAKTAIPDLLYAIENDLDTNSLKESEYLKFEPPNNFKALVVEALGKIGPEAEGVYTVLIKNVKSNDPLIRSQVITTLSKMRKKEELLIPIFIEAIEDKYTIVRRAAAKALGKYGVEAKSAVPHLINALNDINGRVRKEAIKALGNIAPEHEEGFKNLVKLAGDSYPSVRSQVVRTLSKMRLRANTVVPILIKALHDTNNEVRRSAVEALLTIGKEAKEAIPHLINALTDADKRIRKKSIEALGRIGFGVRDCVPPLIEVLKTEKGDALKLSVRALQEIGSVAVASLVKSLHEINPVIRQNVALALGGIGPSALEAVPSLINMLNDIEPSVRKEAATAIGKIGVQTTGSTTALTKALKDDDPLVREEAAIAIGKIGYGSLVAAPDLIKALSDDHSSVRSSAANALGAIGVSDLNVVSALIKTLEQDPNWSVRSSAANALGAIGRDNIAVVSALITSLKQDASLNVRASTAHALGKCGPAAKSACLALIVALKDNNSNLREKAADSLGDIAKDLQDAKETDSIQILKSVHQVLVENPDLRTENYLQFEHAKSVQRAIDYLELIWWQQATDEIVDWMRNHPWRMTMLAIYTLWVIASFLLLWLRPITLLPINKFLSPCEATLPDWLLGIKLSLRYLLIVGFINYRPRVLDAWVDRYINSAREKFDAISTVNERDVHIPVAVTLDNNIIPALDGKALKPTFKNRNACLLIWGEGGAGKTSLACQVAKLAMAETPGQWIADHRMLPILIENELNYSDLGGKDQFTEAIGRQLQLLTDLTEPINEEFLGHLLRRQRLLVIVDHFSEMNEETRAMINPISPLFAVNALLVTSRLKEKLGNRILTIVKPLRIKGDRLSSFMEAYLTHREKRELFSDAEFFVACSRFSEMVGDNREVTLLLAKLYAEQMIATKEEEHDAELPKNIPDLMVSYLNEINRGVTGSKIHDTEIHRYAKIIAWECLRHNFRPAPTRVDDLLTIITGSEAQSTIKYLEDRLHLIKTNQPNQDRIRFLLDPLAEYLASLHLIEIYQGEEQKWKHFLGKVDGYIDVPWEVSGFLSSLLDCCLTKSEEIHFPAFLISTLSEFVVRKNNK